MKIFIVKDQQSLEEGVAQALSVLQNDGVVMHSTDTCFGLAASVFSQQALIKVYRLKQMAEDKPVSMMVESFDRAVEYADFSDEALQFARHFWPGPVTCIVKRGLLLPDFFNSQAATVGVRCPDHQLSLAMVEAFAKPITTTSANLTGLPEVKSVEEYLEQIKGTTLTPDLILCEENYQPTISSTVVDFSQKEAVIVRQGARFDEVQKYLQKEL